MQEPFYAGELCRIKYACAQYEIDGLNMIRASNSLLPGTYVIVLGPGPTWCPEFIKIFSGTCAVIVFEFNLVSIK